MFLREDLTLVKEEVGYHNYKNKKSGLSGDQQGSKSRKVLKQQLIIGAGTFTKLQCRIIIYYNLVKVPAPIISCCF